VPKMRVISGGLWEILKR